MALKLYPEWTRQQAEGADITCARVRRYRVACVHLITNCDKSFASVFNMSTESTNMQFSPKPRKKPLHPDVLPALKPNSTSPFPSMKPASLRSTCCSKWHITAKPFTISFCVTQKNKRSRDLDGISRESLMEYCWTTSSPKLFTSPA